MTTPLTPGAAKKSLGQHFLFDPDILKRIALAAGPVEGRCVIEVGPGPGGLTRALLEAGGSPLIAIERDDRFAQALTQWPEAQEGRLRVVHGDALGIDMAGLVADAGGDGPAMIVANLPYNVGTPLLVDWLKAGGWRGNMALMFQLEVAQRICAQPSEKHYGRLAVLTQAAMKARLAFRVPAGAFRPPPKVDSAVVAFEPLGRDERFDDLDAIETVAAAAFGQRRKMLRASLKQLERAGKPKAAELLSAAGIDPERRPETLSQAEFRALARAWRG